MTLTESADHLPFRPALTGLFAQHFYGQAKILAETPPADLEAFVQAELEWVASLTINPRQQRIYRAVWLLLRDLLRVGWRPRWLASMLEVAPPVTQSEVHTLAEIAQAKELVRQAMAATRLERLAEAQDFIRRMENPSPTARASCPISELVTDGPTLAADLDRIAAINETEQIETLQQTIRPYLQLVSEDERCAYTGTTNSVTSGATSGLPGPLPPKNTWPDDALPDSGCCSAQPSGHALHRFAGKRAAAYRRS